MRDAPPRHLVLISAGVFSAMRPRTKKRGGKGAAPTAIGAADAADPNRRRRFKMAGGGRHFEREGEQDGGEGAQDGG